MNQVKILIGPAGSGKSTYSQQFKDAIILSSDSIRLELFGDLTHQSNEDHAKVFECMNKRFKHILNNKDNTTIIYDATNLSRKRRRPLYEMAKKFNTEVEAIVFFTSLNELIFRNATREISKQVPEKTLLNMYKSIQVPQINFDCDTITCVGEQWFKSNAKLDQIKTVKDVTKLIKSDYDNVINELMLNYTTHDTPYHLENVNQHIEWTIDNSKDFDIKQIAIFHDLGKGINKNYDKSTEHATYRGHEMLGAYYALNYYYSTNQINEQNLNIVMAVAYHMLKRHKMKPNKINKMMTNHYLEYLLNEFNKIDNQSRINSIS